MVWVGIWSTGRTDLVVVNGNMKWQRYLSNIVVPVIVPNLQKIGIGAVFQDENALPTALEVSKITSVSMEFRGWTGQRGRLI